MQTFSKQLERLEHRAPARSGGSRLDEALKLFEEGVERRASRASSSSGELKGQKVSRLKALANIADARSRVDKVCSVDDGDEVVRYSCSAKASDAPDAVFAHTMR